MRLHTTLFSLLAAVAAPLAAQTTPPPAIAQAAVLDRAAARRVAELPALLAGSADPATLFAPEFLAQVPAEQVRALTEQLRTASGPVGAVERVVAISPWSASVEIGYAKGVATMDVVVAPAAPNRITGLRIKGILPRVGSLAEIEAALAGLPGATGIVLARLGEGAPVTVMARNETRAFAIGSDVQAGDPRRTGPRDRGGGAAMGRQGCRSTARSCRAGCSTSAEGDAGVRCATSPGG